MVSESPLDYNLFFSSSFPLHSTCPSPTLPSHSFPLPPSLPHPPLPFLRLPLPLVLCTHYLYFTYFHPSTSSSSSSSSFSSSSFSSSSSSAYSSPPPPASSAIRETLRQIRSWKTHLINLAATKKEDHHISPSYCMTLLTGESVIQHLLPEA